MNIENITISSVKDIEELQGANLLRFVNQLTGGTVKKFKDRATALAKATEAFNAQEGKPVEFELFVTAKDTSNGSTATATKPARTRKAATVARKTTKAKKSNGPRKERERKLFDLKPRSSIKEHRDGTARAKAVKVLLKGATFEQVQKATGWTKHRHAYEGIRLLNTHLGYGIIEKDGVIKLITKKD